MRAQWAEACEEAKEMLEGAEEVAGELNLLSKNKPVAEVKHAPVPN